MEQVYKRKGFKKGQDYLHSEINVIKYNNNDKYYKNIIYRQICHRVW